MEPVELGRDALYKCACGNTISAETFDLLPGQVELGRCAVCGAIFYVMRDELGDLFVAKKR